MLTDSAIGISSSEELLAPRPTLFQARLRAEEGLSFHALVQKYDIFVSFFAKSIYFILFNGKSLSSSHCYRRFIFSRTP